MVCKNLKLKPKNKVLRSLGSFDHCCYQKEVKGIHFEFELFKNSGLCPFKNICKYYKPTEEENG